MCVSDLGLNDVMDLYSRLGDDTSKRIFMTRLQYYLTRESSVLDNLVKEYYNEMSNEPRWNVLLDRLIRNQGKQWVFGSGLFSGDFFSRFPDIRFEGIVETHPKEGEKKGRRIISFKEFIEKYKEDYIILPSPNYYSEMRAQLLYFGFAEEQIIDATFLPSVSETRQYFDKSIMKPKGGEVFVDAGSFWGGSSVLFSAWCGGDFEYIYCFEPDVDNIEGIRNCFVTRGIYNYRIIDKGLWDKEGTLGFSRTGGGTSFVSTELIDRDKANNEMISVISMDEALGDNKVTFIKMDIEGAEYKALKGARRLIQNNKPRLAISVYHKPEDVIEIPRLIMEYNPNYKLYLRQYHVINETVLYAIDS